MGVTAKSAMILDVKVFFLKSENVNPENSSTAPINEAHDSINYDPVTTLVDGVWLVKPQGTLPPSADTIHI